jgi:hypothetical protein
MDALHTILSNRNLDFNPPAFVKPACVQLIAQLHLDALHGQWLENYNGLFAFHRALHVFGCAPSVPFHDIAKRNAPESWREMYGDAANGLRFFAEEAFGNLYAYGPTGIVFFDIESAESTVVAANFEGWTNYIANDTDYATGRRLLDQWSAIHGPLPFGSRLCPKKLFILGGKYEVGNLYAVDWARNLEFHAEVSRQLKNLPEGTKVKIEFRE